MVTVLPYSASIAATINVCIRDEPIPDSPFALAVASLATQSIPKLLADTQWTATVLHMLRHAVEDKHEYSALFDDITMDALMALFQDKPAFRTRVVGLMEAFLREDATKRRAVTPLFCARLMRSGVVLESSALHGIVCRFLAQRMVAADIPGDVPLLRVPLGVHGDAQWIQLL